MKRWVLVALVSTLAFAMLAVFSLLAPPPARPVKPTELEPEAARERARPAHFDEPVRPAEPPPAPEVANDPARGVVWLRVIDFDTNMPLALRRCELCEVETVPSEKPTSEFYWREAVKLSSEFFWREVVMLSTEVRDFEDTDKDGLLSFKVPSDKFTFFGRVRYGDKLEWKYPLPPAFEPVTHPDTVAAAIAALKAAPQTRPIDVQVRAAPRVHGRVWDPEGRPAAGAEVFAWPLEVAPELDALARCLSEQYEWAVNTRHSLSASGESIFSAARAMVNAGLNRSASSSSPLGRWRDGSGVNVPFSSIGGPYRAKTDRNGRYELPPMLRGRWMVCAWIRRLPLAAQNCLLTEAEHEVEFALAPSTTATLVITADVRPSPQRSWRVSTSFYRCGPAGYDLPAGRAFHGAMLTSPGWTATFEDLQPGFVMAKVSVVTGSESFENQQLVQLVVGKEAQVAISAGPSAKGTWQPTVRVNGLSVDTVSAILQGGENATPTKMQMHVTGSELLPGPYMLWLPGQPPVRFEITPGKSTYTVHELSASQASFVVDKAFAQSLGSFSGPLSLILWGEIRDLEALDTRHRDAAGNWTSNIELVAGRQVGMPLFAGSYFWTLKYGFDSISGILVIEPNSSPSFEFSLRGLPGRQRLDIDATALGDKDILPSRVCLTSAQEWRSVLTASRALERISTPPPPPEFSDAPGGETPERPFHWPVYACGNGKFVAFVDAGLYRLSLAGAEQIVRAPGQIVLESKTVVATASVRWRSGAAATEHEVYVVDQSGVTHFVAADRQIRVRTGRATLHATRVVVEGQQTRRLSATTALSIDAKELVVDLDALGWSEFGSFSLVCEGRGSPERFDDAWWWNKDGWRVVEIEALDRLDCRGSAVLRLGSVDEYMPQGRVAFSFKDRAAPPGRYRVVPWPGAPEGFCRTFEVFSGEHTEVVVKGG